MMRELGIIKVKESQRQQTWRAGEDEMRISDSVANYILNLLNQENGTAEIQRNELASYLGCVPSQINYVMSTRFSPERGYIVESRRGGNGYIRITRVQVDRQTLMMHVINSLGGQVDLASVRAILSNLVQAGPGSGAAAAAGPGPGGYPAAGIDPASIAPDYLVQNTLCLGGFDYEMRKLWQE